MDGKELEVRVGLRGKGRAGRKGGDGKDMGFDAAGSETLSGEAGFRGGIGAQGVVNHEADGAAVTAMASTVGSWPSSR